MKSILIAVALVCPAMTIAQKESFTIKGNIAHLNAHAKINMNYYTEDDVISDTANINNGNFLFRGTLNGTPRKIVLSLNHTGSSGPQSFGDFIEIFIVKGITTIVSKDSLKYAKISGAASKVNEENRKLKTALMPFDQMGIGVGKKRMALQANPGKDSVEQMQEIVNSMVKINELRKKAVIQFIKKNPSSWVSLYQLVNFLGGDDYKETTSLFNSLSPGLRNSSLGKKCGEYLIIDKLTAIGNPAPDFTQNDTLGKPVTLSSYKGKFVLVDFWASWCSPCRAENPNVVKAYEQYKDRNFDVLSVSLDGDKNSWLKAISADHLTWTQVSDFAEWDNKVAKIYGVTSIPTNVLIDPSGNIIGKSLRGKDLLDKLEEVLSKFIP